MPSHYFRWRLPCLRDEFLEAGGLLDASRYSVHELGVRFLRIEPLLLGTVLVVRGSSEANGNGWHRELGASVHVVVLGGVVAVVTPLVVDVHVNHAIWVVVMAFHGLVVRRVLESS